MRDFGLYQGVGSGVGALIGSIANPILLGAALPLLAPNASAPAGGDDDGDVRPPFPQEAYRRAMWPWAAVCLLMVPCVTMAGYLLRHKASRKHSLGGSAKEHTPRLLAYAGEGRSGDDDANARAMNGSL